MTEPIEPAAMFIQFEPPRPMVGIPVEMRTDGAYRKSCEAYGNLHDALARVFWWFEWKLRVFGSASSSRKHMELEEAIRKYVDARIESDRNDPARERHD